MKKTFRPFAKARAALAKYDDTDKGDRLTQLLSDLQAWAQFNGIRWDDAVEAADEALLAIAEDGLEPPPVMSNERRGVERPQRTPRRKLPRARCPLPDSAMTALFAAVDDRLRKSPCDHGLTFTMEWVRRSGYKPDQVSEWLRSTGGYCDCEVLMNSRLRWEEGR